MGRQLEAGTACRAPTPQFKTGRSKQRAYQYRINSKDSRDVGGIGASGSRAGLRPAPTNAKSRAKTTEPARRLLSAGVPPDGCRWIEGGSRNDIRDANYASETRPYKGKIKGKNRGAGEAPALRLAGVGGGAV